MLGNQVVYILVLGLQTAVALKRRDRFVFRDNLTWIKKYNRPFLPVERQCAPAVVWSFAHQQQMILGTNVVQR